MLNYDTTGVCAKNIKFELEGNTVKSVSFDRGCNGNLKGIASLVEGLDANEVIKRLKGLKCKNKDTSCPDQLAKALENAINNNLD